MITNLFLEHEKELQALSLKTFLAGYEEASKKYPNVWMDFFLNGKMFKISKEEQSSILKSLNYNGTYSIRMTNVQLINPMLKNLCEDFFINNGYVLTANLYHTPHSEAQCFNFHSDKQQSLIYQLEGEKEWSFLKVGENYLSEKYERDHILNSYTSGKIEAVEEKFMLKKFGMLIIPYARIHQARNLTDRPSTHLTFSYTVPTIGEFLLHLGRKVLKSDRPLDYYDLMDEKTVTEALENFKDKYLDVKNDYLEEFKKKQAEKLQKGKNYL